MILYLINSYISLDKQNRSAVSILKVQKRFLYKYKIVPLSVFDKKMAYYHLGFRTPHECIFDVM